jgi:hypothetical protein
METTHLSAVQIFCSSVTFKRLGRVFKFDGMFYGKRTLFKKRGNNYEMKGALWNCLNPAVA